MISLNKRVMKMVHQLIEDAEALGCRYFELANGSKVLDMGIEVPGSWQAAKLFTEIDMAGLGTCTYTNFDLEDQLSVPAVEVYVDEPRLACLVSQIAGWQLTEGDFAAIGSGPARALAAVAADHCFTLTSYRDNHHEAVLGIQMTGLPDTALANKVAEACRVKPEDVYLLVHPSASVVASVQVSARIIEQTINKMIRKGFDLSQLVLARGICAVAPVVLDELEAMGKINDCLLYGGAADFWVKSTDEEIARVIPQLVTANAKDYGRLFIDLFLAANKDFYQMDLEIHSPAKVQMYNMHTGNVFVAGEIRKDLLRKSLFNNR